MTAKAKVRSEAYKERRRVRERERARQRREAQRIATGGRSRAEWLTFVREQAAKTKAARESALAIQPSVAKRQAMKADTRPGQSVDEWVAEGNTIEVLPGFQSKLSGPIPARHWANVGARGQ